MGKPRNLKARAVGHTLPWTNYNESEFTRADWIRRRFVSGGSYGDMLSSCNQMRPKPKADIEKITGRLSWCCHKNLKWVCYEKVKVRSVTNSQKWQFLSLWVSNPKKTWHLQIRWNSTKTTRRLSRCYDKNLKWVCLEKVKVRSVTKIQKSDSFYHYGSITQKRHDYSKSAETPPKQQGGLADVMAKIWMASVWRKWKFDQWQCVKK